MSQLRPELSAHSPLCSRVESDHTGVTVFLTGEVDLETLDVFADALSPHCDKALTLDLTQVRFFAVSALRVLVEARDLVSRHGEDLILRTPPPSLLRILSVVQEEKFVVIGVRKPSGVSSLTVSDFDAPQESPVNLA